MKPSASEPTVRDQDRLIFALDVSSEEEAEKYIDLLSPQVNIFKIGLQTFLACGFGVVEYIANRDKKAFLDLKFLDIPATVSGALRTIEARYANIVFATIHVLNNALPEIIKAAELARLKVLVVTALTSKDESDLRREGVNLGMNEYVAELTQRALDLGASGVIASPLEVKFLRSKIKREFLIVTPGIRPDWSAVQKDDQKRTANPRYAILNGADYLVVGRPIKDAKYPLDAATRIQAEINDALGELREKDKSSSLEFSFDRRDVNAAAH